MSPRFAGTLEEVAAAARTLEGVVDVEILDKDGEAYLIRMFTHGECSPDKSRELQDRLQRKLDSAGLREQVTLATPECWQVVVPRGDAPAPEAIESISTMGMFVRPLE